MSTRQILHRGSGHPWDGRPGFDLMELRSDTQAELDLWIQRARVKFWHVWISGVYEASGLPGATLYKPSGAKAEWQDGPDCRHPGGDGALIEESVL